ncbi:MAG TPA: NUDIX domain-containing protein [Longimicrobiales bacterium]|nr:NUDIX domain-containing protein [Longimicrobiales bacterium]
MSPRGGDPFEIPAERLPPGFAAQVERPPERPARPHPAATVTLLRDGERGLEALLLRRRKETAFVPGAYVFPGGRLDAADAEAGLLARVRGAPDPWHPEPAYWLAAVREAFEETGVLLAKGARGEWLPDAQVDGEVARWREALLEDEAPLLRALEALAGEVALDDVVHNAHWITPAAEPRRYDTRFFLARLPEGGSAREDPREMTASVWLRPTEALERFRAGTLPMVFPTVRTLEALSGFDDVDAALAHWRGRDVPAIEPRLVRTRTGVAIRDDEGA